MSTTLKKHKGGNFEVSIYFPYSPGNACREQRAVLSYQGPQRRFINPIKQVDGEGLSDNLHLTNEVCDS